MGYDYYSDVQSMILDETSKSMLLMSNTELIIGSALTLLSVAMLLALCVFTLIAIRRGRVYGIFACLAYVFGMIVQWVAVIVHVLSCRVRWEYLITHNASDLGALISFMFTGAPMVYLIVSLCLGAIFCVCATLMAVYCGLQLKSVKKGFSIAALILVIAPCALQILGIFSPIFAIYPKPVLQLIWTAVYNGLLILPALLLAAQGIFVMIDNKKKIKRLMADVHDNTEE